MIDKNIMKAKMDKTQTKDPKMNEDEYPVNYNWPAEKSFRTDMLGDLHNVLGPSAFYRWCTDQLYDEPIDLEEVLDKLWNGEISE